MGRQQNIPAKTPEANRVGGSLPQQPTPLEPAPGNDILAMQQTIGNRAVTQLLGSVRLQPKLRVGPPDDVYEWEADRMADAVARDSFAAPAMLSPSAPAVVQRKCAECAEEDEELRRKPALGGVSLPSAEFSAADMPRGGVPLVPSLRSLMEPAFRRDFGGVRIHTGDRASAAAGKLRARAFHSRRGHRLWTG